MRFTLLLCLSANLASADPVDWKLTWSDEFNGSRIDPSKWSPCVRGTSDRNNTMVRDPRCYKIGSGTLRLIGIVNPDKKKDAATFLTGGITSQGKFRFQHGRIEIRARFKSARGV